jgi:hypothetical protein
MSTDQHTALLALCHNLEQAGIWLYLNDQGGLIAGPTALVGTHPQLLHELRQHKEAIIRLLEDSLEHALFGQHRDDPRFTRDTCPDCHQDVYVITSPRRLAVHRLAGNTVCPGSNRAQSSAADHIMTAFVMDRCHRNAQVVSTWHGLRGALEAWCLQREFFLPPRPFLLAWLDEHFTRLATNEDIPRWRGLGLKLEEWLGEDDETQPELLPQATKTTRLIAQ